MRLLDLFCGAGGCSVGYQMAGFHVTGIDHKPQPRYAGDVFIQADALEYLAEHGSEFDAIHASPPCQGYSEITPLAHRQNHPDLIAPTRDLLRATGKPYVIENVEGARMRMRDPLMLCGSMLGLPIWRHRYFEIWPETLLLVPPCRHDFNPILITDHGGPNANGPGKPRKRTPVEVKRAAAGIDWMTEVELSQAIPPAYTEWIGRWLMDAVTAGRAAAAAEETTANNE